MSADTVVWIITVVAVVVFWLVATSWRPWQLFDRAGFSADFYDEQARAFWHGRLAVDPAIPGPEGFVVDGKTYLYYGPFLSLVRMPLMLFGDLFVGRLVRVSMLIAVVVLCRWSARSGSRRPCGDPVDDTHESGRRPLGDGDLHRGGRVLPGPVRRRLDLGLQRDRVVGTDPRGDRLCPDRRVGRIRVRRSPAAAGRVGRRAGRHTDSRADRARCLGCAHRLRWRAPVAQSDHRLRSRSLGVARRAAPDRRPCRGQLREVRHLDLGTRGSTVALVDRPGSRGLVRRQQREFLLNSVPAHHVGAVPAPRRHPVRTVGPRHPVRPLGGRSGKLSGRVDHPGVIAARQCHPVARPGGRGRRLDDPAPESDLAAARRRGGGRRSADVHDRVRRQPLSDRHAAAADRGGCDRNLGGRSPCRDNGW